MGCGESKEELTPEKITKALIEALNQAANVAVMQTGSQGAFQNKQSAIHIQIPGDLGEVMNKCKSLPGLGDKVQEFEDKMNEAAEKACAKSLDILQNAINGLNFENARAILDGATNAATAYFIAQCKDALTERFMAVVKCELDDLNVGTIIDALISAYNAIPFIDKAKSPEMPEYVTNEAMKALFTKFEQEEAKIRGNPAGEQSELIKDVFGQAGKGEEQK